MTSPLGPVGILVFPYHRSVAVPALQSCSVDPNQSSSWWAWSFQNWLSRGPQSSCTAWARLASALLSDSRADGSQFRCHLIGRGLGRCYRQHWGCLVASVCDCSSDDRWFPFWARWMADSQATRRIAAYSASRNQSQPHYLPPIQMIFSLKMALISQSWRLSCMLSSTRCYKWPKREVLDHYHLEISRMWSFHLGNQVIPKTLFQSRQAESLLPSAPLFKLSVVWIIWKKSFPLYMFSFTLIHRHPKAANDSFVYLVHLKGLVTFWIW